MDKITLSQSLSNMTLQDVLVNCAQDYYDYLEANKLGLDVLKVFKALMFDNELHLEIDAKFVDLDLGVAYGMIFCIDGKGFLVGEGESISISSYDKITRTLIFSLDSAILSFIANAIKNKAKLELFSDLKFLVNNVRLFFEKFGSQVALPRKIPSVAKFAMQAMDLKRLNKQQQYALQVVLTSPLSYVWGPPGTGKTQAVLFEALLLYAKQNKRVCVACATNSALEQVLSTLINCFDNLGFDRQKIIRLGTPSARFYQSFSDVCDPALKAKTQNASLFDYQDNSKHRLESALIVGVTLDGFIKKNENLNLSFAHFFVDECASAPLVKICALCVSNTPLSLFGDHKQLSPVCEVKQQDAKNLPLTSLWSISSLGLEAFVNYYNDARFYEKYKFRTDKLRYTNLAILNKTHRYGNNLAFILDKYIYNIGLQGNDTHIELFVLDSGPKAESNLQISQNEVNICSEMAGGLNSLDMAFITPFNNQRKLLISSGIFYGRIFTIHSSQGQEFENVIFSPVSLHFYLTDSRQLNALYALNVAISRVKKRLFIVCDYYFWQKQKNQLITELLSQSKKITLEDFLSLQADLIMKNL